MAPKPKPVPKPSLPPRRSARRKVGPTSRALGSKSSPTTRAETSSGPNSSRAPFSPVLAPPAPVSRPKIEATSTDPIPSPLISPSPLQIVNPDPVPSPPTVEIHLTSSVSSSMRSGTPTSECAPTSAQPQTEPEVEEEEEEEEEHDAQRTKALDPSVLSQIYRHMKRRQTVATRRQARRDRSGAPSPERTIGAGGERMKAVHERLGYGSVVSPCWAHSELWDGPSAREVDEAVAEVWAQYEGEDAVGPLEAVMLADLLVRGVVAELRIEKAGERFVNGEERMEEMEGRAEKVEELVKKAARIVGDAMVRVVRLGEEFEELRRRVVEGEERARKAGEILMGSGGKGGN